ncbi:SusE domain-containing protein [Flammeovirga aprica]|uniref:SusE outer membrane protein domain-containing protein n=1 Tax=Flammeovirga aprica JL-4 TaxID=694437 RepID=A0A7X9P2R3_9BACT|nr:SusE domain-containing protein [Flammeovirga aprica]NME68255.1 hypothetical protein [Flammeovirga aprica JL-4]
MKKALSILTILLTLFSCHERELTHIGYPEDYVSPEFTKGPDGELYVFTKETAGDVFETLEWSPASFGAKTEHNYQIMASIEGYDAVEVVTLVNGSATQVEISQKEMNDAIMKITGVLSEGMVVEENVDLGIRAFIGDFPTGTGVVSSTKQVVANIFPYFTPTLPSNKIFVRGDHQDWAENDETTILGSVEEEGGPYNGYMYLNNEFKICAGPTWGDPAYGQKGDWESDGNGFSTAIAGDGENIKVTPGPGMFFMSSNGSSTLMIEPLTFKLKGSAIPGGEIVMDYDQTNRYLYANVDFVDGSFTFYANNDHNLGKGEADGVTENNGEPIEVKAGTRMIVLDLKNPGTYIYFYRGAVEITAPEMAPLTITDYVLTKDDKDQSIETISWSESVYGDETLEKYQVLLGSQVMYEGVDLSVTLTVEELNAAALKDGGEADKATKHGVKVVAIFAEGSKLESELQEINITPYQAFASEIYVSGDFNDWKHNDDDVVNLDNPEGDYSNWFWMPEGGFKFTSLPNFDGTNYGYESDGVLSTTGGNIPVDAENHYSLKMNPEKLTYELEALEWGLIGDAVKGGGGWETDTPLTFDVATKTWYKEVELVAGANFKFRANNNWDHNLGLTDVDGEVGRDGGDLSVEVADVYTVTLTYDSDARKFTYTIVKK